MKIVIFGLTISSTWANGHATLWRGLCRALARRGHRVHFFERDVPYYAAARDQPEPDGCTLVLYRTWNEIRHWAARTVRDADLAMVTSYCPDAAAASELVRDSGAAIRAFYDLDTPVTLDRLSRGEPVDYLPAGGLGGFDLVLSFTGGGEALGALRRLGAASVAPLYGSVDPTVHMPAPRPARPRWAMSYLGTYASDRQAALATLLLEPARVRSQTSFVIAGSQYPPDFPWRANVFYVSHLPAREHSSFYADSRITLNVTRAPMAARGYCPSGRLFEAAACGVPLASDRWPGLSTFFEPGHEIALLTSADEALAAIDLGEGTLGRMARAARERTLACHTADVRVRELESLVAGSGRVAANAAGGR